MRPGLANYEGGAAEARDAARAQALRAFREAGCLPIETSVVTPADVFLDRLGERFRSQTCFFEDGTGAELCLRPEMTIPVCQTAMEGGYRGDHARAYAYAGSVFRLSDGGAGALSQSLQAGVELLGDGDETRADARAIALALAALRACGVRGPRVVLSDAGAFRDLIAGLSLSDRQRARLAKLFDAHGSALAAHLPPEGEARAPKALDLDLARAEVAARLEAEGLTTPGRDPEDVARRLSDRADRARAAAIPAQARAALDAFFALAAPLAEAGRALDALFDARGIASDAPARLGALAAALGQAGVDPASVRFDASVHAPLGYYSGLEFRIEADGPGGALTVAGGGRYDGLFALIARRPGWRVPAVGFALRLDEVVRARGAPQ